MQKLIGFYHDKYIDKLELWYFTKPGQQLLMQNLSIHGERWEPRRKNSRRCFWWSIRYSHEKQLLNKLSFENQQTLAKLLLGLMLANYTFFDVSTHVDTRWDLVPGTGRFTPQQNKTRSFKNMVLFCFQRTRPECRTEFFYTTGIRKKVDCFSVDGFFSHCNTVSEAVRCFYHFCPCQEVRPSLTEEYNKSDSKKTELDELSRSYIQEKASLSLYWWSVSGGDCTGQLLKLNNMPEKNCQKDVHWQITNC